MFIYLLIVIIFLIYYKLNKLYKYWEIRNVKYLKPTYLFGNLLKSTLGQISVYQNMVQLYQCFPNERYAGIFFMTKPVLIIRDPELIKAVLIKDFDHFTDHRPVFPDGIDPVWNRNLLFLRGLEWKRMRSILTPTFTSSKMKLIFNLIQGTVLIHMNHLKDLNKKNNMKVKLKDTCSRFTNDVMASVIFGFQINSVDDANNFYSNALKLVTVGLRETVLLIFMLLFPNICKALHLTFSRKSVRMFFHKIVMDTIQHRKMNGCTRPDMITLLMEEQKRNGNIFTNEDILSQVVIFLFAGFDTVSTTLTFCLLELSRNPEVQSKLQNEIDEYINENGDITYEGLLHMKYLDQVVSEALRLWPPTITGDRICTKTYTIEPNQPHEKRLILTPGDLIWVVVPGLHRDPKYFPNPEKFYPERFNDTNKSQIDPIVYQPFGVGPRHCIGLRLGLMKVKSFLFHLMKDFNVVPATSKTAKLNNNTFHLQLDSNFEVGLILRKNKIF